MFRHQNFPHGNYPFYYEYRHGKNQGKESLEETIDSRLLHFDQILATANIIDKEPEDQGPLPHLGAFASGAACLDIGCNVGLVTKQISQLLAPRWILGVDIDAGLVERARMTNQISHSNHDCVLRFACEDWANPPPDAPIPSEYDLIFW